MHTEIHESDPFTARKAALLATLDTDYRFERNDELFLTVEGKRIKVRIINVMVELTPQGLRRDLLALRL